MIDIKELEQLIKQSRIISNLSEEIVDDSEIKVGSWVICIDNIMGNYISSGYKKEFVFKVSRIDTYENHDGLGETRYVYWNGYREAGVWDLHVNKTYSRD